MKQGRAFALVGASGVGKDSVLAALAVAQPGLMIVRRVITRPEDQGGEPFEGVSDAEFARRKDGGAFALDWRAHGLSYGIPAAALKAVTRGETVVFNCSRSLLAQAAEVFDGLTVLHLTAPPEVLADRLAQRGRETRDEIARRLSRPAPPLPKNLPVIEIDNSGQLDDTVTACLDALASAPSITRGKGSTVDQIVLTNARLVLEDGVHDGTLVIREGRIVEIGDGRSAAPGATDCEGDLLIPGLIELHTDNLERHIQPRPRVDWPHGPAILAHDGELASVGITTVFDAMRVGSIPSGKGRYLRYARPLASELMEMRASGALKISHYLHLRAEVCSETLEEELAEFAPEDRVGLVSLMDHTPGQRQFRDISKLKLYVQGKNNLSDDEFDAHVENLRALRDRHGDRHERAAVDEAGRLGAILASHDDTTRPQVEVSAGHGIRLAEFPTTQEAAQACHDHDIAVMMGAPNLIRGGSHSGNVAAAELAEAGLLDILSSDYVPSALLTGAFLLADLWGDLPRGIGTVTAAPARATGLGDRGRIAEGLHADLVRVARIGQMPVVRAVWCHGRRVS